MIDVRSATATAWLRDDPRRFDLAVAGQSWHWMDPDTRFAHAARAVRDDGHLALLWNSPQRRESDLRSALDEAYATHAPDLAGDPPGGKAGLAGADPAEEIEASDAFDLVEVVEEPWSRTYDADQYLRLLATQSDHRLLGDEARDGLFDAISGAIDRAGGSIEIDYVCRAFVARRG